MALGQTNTREMQLQLEGQLDDISELVDRIDARSAEVRKTPSWPRSWANFSLF